MASGQKEVTFNTRERVVSTDHNRAQAFNNATIAEIMRALCDTSQSTDDLDAGGVAIENSTLTTPVTAEVLNGLMVQPQAGTTSCYVSAGEVFFIAPDAGADDSNYKYAYSAGVASLGALVIAANGGGSPRIDIIECQWASGAVEAGNRDIYDPVTDTFTSTAVTKATASVLTYRVRQGTIGGGFASVGTALGWLPLAVVSMPGGGTTVDNATFWDVRPFLTDRVYGMANVKKDLPQQLRAQGKSAVIGGTVILSGIFEATLGARRVGGRIRPGVPLADAQQIDVAAVANQAAGSAPGATDWWGVYFCTPFGLPRWARYTDGPAGRQPRSPRGIPVVTNIRPDQYGRPVAVISLPVSTGLGGTIATTEAIMVTAGRTTAGSVIRGCTVDGVAHMVDAGSGPGTIPGIAGTALANGTATFALPDNTFFPANAKAIYVQMSVVDGAIVAAPAAGSIQECLPSFSIYDAGGTNVLAIVNTPSLTLVNPTAAPRAPTWSVTARLPIIKDYPTATPGSRKVIATWGGVGAAPSVVTMYLLGFEL